MQRQHQLSGVTLVTDLPTNCSQLKIRRDELEHEYLACKKRITQKLSGTQRFNLNQEIAAIKAEINLINKRLINLDEPVRKPGKNDTTRSRIADNIYKAEKKISKRQEQLIRLGLQPFPCKDSAKEKYEWALSSLNLAICLLHGENKTNLTDHQLIEALGAGFSCAIADEKLLKLESDYAKTFLAIADNELQ